MVTFVAISTHWGYEQIAIKVATNVPTLTRKEMQKRNKKVLVAPVQKSSGKNRTDRYLLKCALSNYFVGVPAVSTKAI